MLPVRIEGFTRQLNPPKDWDEGRDGPCATVYVRDAIISDMPFMVMCYEPMPAEIEAIKNGAKVYFGINGLVLPVHFIEVK